MTNDQPTPVEAFIAKVTQAHPRLQIAIDAPAQATGSTFIDIRAGDDLIVVEHRPDRGFGFSHEASESGLYGTPSAVFLPEVEKALAHLEQLLSHALTTGADEAGRHGA